MTTTVIVEAHCAEDVEVVVELQDGANTECAILKNGQTFRNYVYGERRIVIEERLKELGT